MLQLKDISVTESEISEVMALEDDVVRDYYRWMSENPNPPPCDVSTKRVLCIALVKLSKIAEAKREADVNYEPPCKKMKLMSVN